MSETKHKICRIQWIEKCDTIPYPEPVVSHWHSSGNPVCLKLRPQCTLECHWRKIVGSQCASSGLPVGFQCVPIVQINTGWILGHHWVVASASVVPVASQCNCGSSGLPVWSVQGYPSELTKSALEVIRSSHFPACNPLCESCLISTDLIWLANLNTQKTIMVLISKACTEWCWNTHMC